MKIVKLYTHILIILITLTLALPNIAFGALENTPNPNINDPSSWVCSVLEGIGMPCGGRTATTTPVNSSNTNDPSTPTPQTSPESRPSLFSRFFGGLFGSSSNNGGFQTATIIEGFGGRVNRAKDAIILVRVPGSSDVYRIMGGKKFLIPTQVNNAVFNSYAFNEADILPISREKLVTYPRVKLVTVVGTSSKTVYYLTETGMLRRIPNKKVFESYADVDHDIAVINSVEFSLYPKNQYIFNEETSVVGQKPQVYLISNFTKQTVSYDQLRILGVVDSMIAPVNQTEFDSYKTLKGNAVLLNSSTSQQDNSKQNISTQYN